MPDFRPAGEPSILGFDGQPIDRYFNDDLFDRAQSLIEELAVVTGNSWELKPGRVEGVFAIFFGRDRDGNKTVGLQPQNAINADIVNSDAPATE
jgi:hypothetical protein